SSLFVALVINPVFTSTFMKVDEKSEDPAVRRRKRRNILIGAGIGAAIAVMSHFGGVMWLRNILIIVIGVSLLNMFFLRDASFYFQNKVLPILERGYNGFIRGALRGIMPGVVFGGTIVLLFVALILLGLNMPKVELFPTADPAYVNAFVELPVGKDIEATDAVMEEIEEKVVEIVKPYSKIVEAVLSQIGENTGDPNAGPDFGASPHKARLTVSFVPTEEREGISTFDVMEELRAGLDGFAGIKIAVDKNQDGPPTGKPINIELTGEEINTLANLSEDIVKFIENKNIPGIEELKKDVQIGKPELIVNIDREAARRFEISTFQIADVIRTAVFGKEISKFKQGDDEYPIQLRAKSEVRYRIEEILNQKVTFRSPANGQISQVPIGSVADINYSSTYTSINRKDQERIITIYSNVLEGYNSIFSSWSCCSPVKATW
ncbi:MAG: efflux RND transporter permease subunit, partial [Bacteroidota bacterium]